MNIEITHEAESRKDTMAFIDANRNWNAEKQEYKRAQVELNKVSVSDCKIYWRGEYLIVEVDGTVHYWDSFPYCFLKMAVEFFEIEKPSKWKTAGRLISLRMGIRQTEVNCMGYVETILEQEKMTKSLYDKFMRLAREQDLQHHGPPTF
jgi:hypothetical protein